MLVSAAVPESFELLLKPLSRSPAARWRGEVSSASPWASVDIPAGGMRYVGQGCALFRFPLRLILTGWVSRIRKQRPVIILRFVDCCY